MPDNKTINEENLEQVNGGFFVAYWVCPECGKQVKPRDIVSKEEDGVLKYYCPKCDKYYPKEDWGCKQKLVR